MKLCNKIGNLHIYFPFNMLDFADSSQIEILQTHVFGLAKKVLKYFKNICNQFAFTLTLKL